MSSINLKRSAATLGVVAGLLAAAAPASAQIGPGTIGVKAPINAEPLTPLITNGTADDVMEYAHRANSGEVAVESLTLARKSALMDTNGDQLFLFDGGGLTHKEPAVLDAS